MSFFDLFLKHFHYILWGKFEQNWDNLASFELYTKETPTTSLKCE